MCPGLFGRKTHRVRLDTVAPVCSGGRPVFSSDSLVKQPCKIVRDLTRPRGGRRVSALARRTLVPSASRGGGAPIGASSELHAFRRAARPLAKDAAPFGAPRGVGRPDGVTLPLPARFQRFALGVAFTVANTSLGVVLPRGLPRAAREPCLQGTGRGRRTPLHPPDASGGALE